MGFEIKSRGGQHPHLPEQLMDGVQSTMDIETVMEASTSMREARDMWDPDQIEHGDFFLPPFQRPAVWTVEQKVRFVESALLGISLGSLVVVDAMNMPMQTPERYARTDRWLLDGQQRVGALLDYRHDRITVFEGSECAHRWSDLTPIEIRRVRRIQIGVIRIRTDDEAYARQIYDRLNYGGTAHTEDQRAVGDEMETLAAFLEIAEGDHDAILESDVDGLKGTYALRGTRVHRIHGDHATPYDGTARELLRIRDDGAYALRR